MLTASALAIGMALFFALALNRQQPLPHAQVQMSRIDFAAPLPGPDVQAVRGAVMQVPGVKHCYVNPEAGTLTFSYDLREQERGAVLTAVQQSTAVGAHLFEVPASMAASGCPVTGPNAPLSKAIALVGQVWPF
ncbi:MAG: hypothetical protein RIC19_19930 [Phaeodactylibacter sp.]|uniref:heavy-metal-associated domain-containing protein n=1 Tax=Phaeodactylibacter sp. TaxID=1940289 RepID=UPI0032EFA743